MSLRRLYQLMLLLPATSGSLLAQTYVIKDVNIIPMTKEVVLRHQTVIIENGKINSMGNAKEVAIPSRAQVIDGRNNYLMPGLTDMHAHFFYEQGVSPSYIPEELKVMLANGVTTVRIMNGCKLYQKAKDEIAGKKILGPELFVVSPQFVGEWPWKNDTIAPKQIVTNEQEAKDAVRKYKREGYDEIKITFFVKKPAYEGIIKAAAEEHLKVTGHIGHDVKLPRALVAKQQIEHLDEFMEMLLPDTSTSQYSVSGPSIWSKKAWQTVPYLNENKIPGLVKMVKDANVYISPTNYFFKVNFGIGQSMEEIKNSVDYPYIPTQLLKARADARSTYWSKLAIDEPTRLRWYDLRKRIIKGLAEAGVMLMSGSDAPEWYLVQGFTVHNEVANMVECGLSNYDALKTTTVNPCTYLGIFDRKGTVSKGKDADLVLLSKNPLENIANIKSINGVFRQGKYYSRQALNELLQQVVKAKGELN